MFEKHKKDFLAKQDKSKKGKVDKEIAGLVKLINKHPDYYTTSSCSGRITLLKKPSEKKHEASWVFVSHEKITFENIKNVLKKLPKEEVWFMAEPAIFHVSARTIEDAQKIIDLANKSGFKKSGIISARNKIIVEVKGTERIETLLSKNNKLLLPEDYIKYVINAANKKLEKTRKKLKLFQDYF
ncbi:hypothetical protein KY339_01975 [Candidatus Woesearchaeota archaeon]|nr:hypothetical protein [Candidatus Woesearchaeota archaeon]